MSVWTRALAALRLWPGNGAGGADDQLARFAPLRDAFEVNEDAFLNLTRHLTRRDRMLIGTVVQVYCYADFNARRIVAAFDQAATGSHREPSRLPDGKVFSTLDRHAREHLDDGNLKEGMLKAIGTLEMHRDHRHGFAHWATRRVKGADALVMFTMSANAAEKRTGMPLGGQEARFGILPLAGFRREVTKLEGHANYLAVAAAHIDTHLAELAERIADRRAQAATGQEGQARTRGGLGKPG